LPRGQALFLGHLQPQPSNPLGLEIGLRLSQLLSYRVGVWLAALGRLQTHRSGHLGTPGIELLLQVLAGATFLSQVGQQGFLAAGTGIRRRLS
jgi:hypothetical protein